MSEQPSTGQWSNERTKDGFYKQQRVLKTRIAHDPLIVERTEYEELLAIRWAAQRVIEWADGAYEKRGYEPGCLWHLRAGIEGRLDPRATGVPADGGGAEKEK